MINHYTYIMEDTREAKRLADKVDASGFIDTYLKDYITEDTDSVLDIGCGPAIIDVELGKLYPKKQFIGIDNSEIRIAQARMNLRDISNVRIELANASQLPYPSNTFDLIFCRFLLEYLPDKPHALLEMYRVCKPGGKIILQDLDGQIVSMYPPFRYEAQLKSILNYLEKTGFDPFVGRKLFYLSTQANLLVEKLNIEPYHLIAGKINDKDYEAWKLKLDIISPYISKALGDDTKANDFNEAYLEYLLNPNTFSYSTLFTIVTRK